MNIQTSTTTAVSKFASMTHAAFTAASLWVVLTSMTAISATAETQEQAMQPKSIAVQANAASLADTNMMETGSLVIYRGKGLSANSLMYYRVYVDGKMLGQLKRNTAFYLNLSPGEHLIETNDPEESALRVMVKKNQTAYINTSINKHWKVAMQSVQPGPSLAARLDNCATNVKTSCVLEESARLKSNRIVSR